jgi:hypothetical protein
MSRNLGASKIILFVVRRTSVGETEWFSSGCHHSHDHYYTFYHLTHPTYKQQLHWFRSAQPGGHKPLVYYSVTKTLHKKRAIVCGGKSCYTALQNEMLQVPSFSDKNCCQTACYEAVCLTLNPLTCRIWWAPNNASRWQMGFNSAFKGLIYMGPCIVIIF